MQNLMLLDIQPFGLQNNRPAAQVVHEIQTMDYLEAPIQLPQKLEFDYLWYCLDNKYRALEFMEAFLLAAAMQLTVQATLNREQVISLLTRDMADRFYGMAQERLGYTGSITVQRYDLVTKPTFRVPISTQGNIRVEWVIDQIEKFGQHIPLHALRAMEMFQDAGYTPDAYWVADKVQTVVHTPRSLDPIVLAQFGSWFAGIAMWV